MKPRAYIYGPMTGYPEHNFPAFDKAKVYLESLGYDVISPADLDRQFGITGNEANGTIPKRLIQEVMLIELREILSCNVIVGIKGWEQSKGSACEKTWSVNWKIPDIPIEDAAEWIARWTQSNVPPQTPATTPA